MAFKHITVIFLTVVVAAGCAAPTTKRAGVNQSLVEAEARKQREIALEEETRAQKRLMRVAFPVLESSVELCGDNVRPSLGMIYLNKYDFKDEMREVAIARLDVGESLQVVEVIENTPAAQAGVQNGDILVSLGGVPAPTGAGATEDLFEISKKITRAGIPVELELLRNGKRITTTIVPGSICDYPVLVTEGEEINAYADGEKIMITRGMMRFATNDQELALIVAHELAHNAMSHITAKKTNYVLGSVVDVLAAAYGIDTQGTFGKMAASAYSQEFESEADYVGLYMMAMSGYEIRGAANFWRRMASVHPGSIEQSHLASHPATPERFVAIEDTVIEIERKKAAGEQLLPNMKDDS